jgi:uncharacterized protein with HEPN domain
MNREMDKGELVKIKIIHEALHKILEFTNGMMNAEDLTSNIMAWDAVKMNLVVIYETDLKIDPEFKKKYQNVNWDQIKDNKSILENNYLGFDSNEIWKAIQYKMPEFKKQIEAIF